MKYEELSSYFRSKLATEVVDAGEAYYTKGKGSMFRYPVVEMPKT